jgi:cysteine desulfurase NifS/selenium donor protein
VLDDRTREPEWFRHYLMKDDGAVAAASPLPVELRSPTISPRAKPVSDTPIYLDHNATTPIDPDAAAAMLPFLHEHFGNPSSAHAFGVATRRAIETARRQLAALLGARAEEIVFTSGGSESNNTVIKGVAAMRRDRGRHVVTSAIEHPAVLEPCEALEAEGFSVTRLPVDARGLVDPRELERALTPETILVTVMHANNEVGTIQPIAEIARIAHERGALVHTDAAQSIGKVPVHVGDLGVDFLTVAGHKLYAPKGVGALYVRAGLELPKLLHGASHEANRRAGTENVLEIVGLGRASELAATRLDEYGARTRELRDRLLARLEERLGALRVNGDLDGGLPNTLSVCFRGVDAATLLAEIGDRVAASAGAACHADGVDLSTVLEAMAVPVEEAMGTVRFSVGWTTRADEVDRAAEIVADAVARMRGATSPSAPIDDDGPIKLTRFTQGMGCACKLRPQELEKVLAALPTSADPRVLVGASTSDDAAVYQVTDDLALVQTLDFFTPIADDPYEFGAISASNALSDLYAMGAEPRFALSIVAFPASRLPLAVLQRILEGAHAVAREAGIEILGGHTVDDPEPKYGLAATGLVHPERIWTNAGARPGDALVLTKPIGTGIVATATKQGLASDEQAARGIAVMRALNRDAAEAARELAPSACTDVTGFGLLGHLLEMTRASGVDAEIDAGAVPVLEGARDLAAAGATPGGSLDNLAHVEASVDFDERLSRVDRVVLADAQTSGGLLIALAPDDARSLVGALGTSDARVIGRCTTRGTGRVTVRGALDG